MKQRYLSIDHAFLAVEREQLLDEGGISQPLPRSLTRWRSEPPTSTPIRVCKPAPRRSSTRAPNLPMRADYSYDEPSDLEGIRRARPTDTPFMVRHRSGRRVSLRPRAGRVAGALRRLSAGQAGRGLALAGHVGLPERSGPLPARRFLPLRCAGGAVRKAQGLARRARTSTG